MRTSLFLRFSSINWFHLKMQLKEVDVCFGPTLERFLCVESELFKYYSILLSLLIFGAHYSTPFYRNRKFIQQHKSPTFFPFKKCILSRSHGQVLLAAFDGCVESRGGWWGESDTDWQLQGQCC